MTDRVRVRVKGGLWYETTTDLFNNPGESFVGIYWVTCYTSESKEQEIYVRYDDIVAYRVG
jgi:hypothetical protein